VMQVRYLEGIWRAGGIEAIVAPRAMSEFDATDLLGRVDGLILVGGGDVDPTLYGAEREPEVYGVDGDSDALEVALVRAAISQNVPTLAICRGMQVLNVACGGSLVQHITRKPGYQSHGQPGEGFALHSVTIAAGSLLSKTQGGASALEACWSYHHQVVDQLGENLIVSAHSEDGAIEAIEFDQTFHDGWLIGIQWHPERTAHGDASQQALFDSLLDQARIRLHKRAQQIHVSL
jgi:putative glutamine amidotransferase